MSIDTNQNTNAIVTLVEDGDDLLLPIPDHIFQSLNWNENDILEWYINIDNSITLRKQV